MKATRRGLVLGPGSLPLGVLLFVIYGVHDNTGSSTTALLFCGGIAAVAVNLAWSWIAVRRATVTVVSSPTDAVVGDVAAYDVQLLGAVGEVVVTMTTAPNRPVVVGRAGDTGALGVLVPFRGVAVGAGFEIRCVRPFGLVGARRLITLAPLPQPLVVAPRPLAAPRLLEHVSRRLADADDDIRAVRPYVPGDPRRNVHWPTSARIGALVVRELEPPRTTVTVEVDLGDGHDPRRSEGIAAAAAWVLGELLRRGADVRLLTREGVAPATGVVADTRAVGRRLATATPGPPLAAPAGWEPDVRVVDR